MQKISDKRSVLGFDENMTAMFGYLMGLGAIILFFIEKNNVLIRFHAIQSVLYSISHSILLMLIIFFFRNSDFQYLLIISVVSSWIFGMFYAVLMSYQKKYFKFPLIGNLAEKWSGSKS